jgi:hypothetical protein
MLLFHFTFYMYFWSVQILSLNMHNHLFPAIQVPLPYSVQFNVVISKSYQTNNCNFDISLISE